MIVNGLEIIDSTAYALLNARKTEPNLTGRKFFERVQAKHRLREDIKILLKESQKPEDF